METCVIFILSFVILYSLGNREFRQNCVELAKDFQYILKTNPVSINKTSYHCIDYYYMHLSTMLLCIFDTLIKPTDRNLYLS